MQYVGVPPHDGVLRAPMQRAGVPVQFGDALRWRGGTRMQWGDVSVQWGGVSATPP